MMASEPTANSLVLHDWPGELDLLKWFDLAYAFISDVGAVPNVCACGESQNQVRVLQPKNFRKRLQEGKQYQFASVYAATDVRDPSAHWTAACGFSTGVAPMKTLDFHRDSRGRPLDCLQFISLVRQLTNFVEPPYGYAYQRAYSKGPEYYAYDLAFGLDDRLPEDKDEKNRMLLWHLERLDMVVQKKPAQYRHLRGLFRDVFPLNFISLVHLAQAVEGVPLEAWIRADRSRGTLVSISTNLWSWELPDNSLVRVRDTLQRASLLIERPNLAH